MVLVVRWRWNDATIRHWLHSYWNFYSAFIQQWVYLGRNKLRVITKPSVITFLSRYDATFGFRIVTQWQTYYLPSSRRVTDYKSDPLMQLAAAAILSPLRLPHARSRTPAATWTGAIRVPREIRLRVSAAKRTTFKIIFLLLSRSAVRFFLNAIKCDVKNVVHFILCTTGSK